MADSTVRRARRKPTRPAKPYAKFPLFPHQTGRWAKKVRGKIHFFGRWGRKQGHQIIQVEDVEASAKAAKLELDRQWPFISEGRTAPSADTSVDTLAIRDLCNAFWRSKRAKLLAGELSQRSFRDYENTTDLLVEFFGRDRRVEDLRPEDFERLRSSMAERWGPHTLRNEVNRIRVVFKFAADNALIDRPVVYGQSFNRPSAKALRKARNAAGPRMFEATELHTILGALDRDPALQAMVLLGVNCGFGNTDVATLPQSAVDLDDGWVNFPRPKTEINRRVPLWSETVEAIREALPVRPRPAPGNDDLCFLTRNGERFVRVQVRDDSSGKVTPIDSLSQKFAKLLKRLGVNGGRNFYALRHTFETVGGESRDQVAVNAIMGHVDSSMAGVYRERISDERLRAVVDTVRAWLWPSTR